MPQNKTHPVSLDPRSPLVLDTHELGRRPGSMRPVRRTVPAPGSLALELVRVPEGSPVELDLRLESVVEGVLVSGPVSAEVTGECGRCLRPITDAVTVEIRELFAYPDSTTDQTADEEEVSRLQGDLIDLEPVLRDAIVLALPVNPLCRDDCPGLCPECGQHWDELPSDHTHEHLDPRWEALRSLIGDDAPASERAGSPDPKQEN